MEDFEIVNLKNLLDIEEGFKLESVPMRKSEYKRAKKLLIKPSKTEWCYTLLAVFLNELTKWKMEEKNPHRTRSCSDKTSYNSFKISSCENSEMYLLIKIEKNKINVKGSKSYIDEWFGEEFIKECWIQKSSFIKFTTSASKALYRDSPLIFYPLDEFTPLFINFVSFFVKKKFEPLNQDTNQIYNFHNKFLAKNVSNMIDLQKLIKNNEGYLYFNLATNNNTGKKLDTCLIDGQKYFILVGTYFSPYIVSLIQNNLVNGIQLDTTWSVLDNFCSWLSSRNILCH